ncbi:neuronatin isoform X1 [Mus musculus]|nr:neuronatin isoform X1 [Mus musculus]|eukprot:XP_006498964.1 PREDICTED: neuronatin isoform X1 [Mus musculus]
MAAVAAASAELLIIGWYIFRVLLQTLSPVRPRPAGNKDSGVRRSPAADDRDQRGVPGMLHLLGRIRFSKSSRDTAHCEKCSGTPCRSWRTRCPGPGGRCWGSAGSEPPTEAPAPSPGRPCHQVLLCFSTSMGASAAQEWGVPCVPSSEEHLPRSVRGR